jgi:hypothetical protein
VADVVRIEGDTRMRAAQQLGEHGFARLDRQSRRKSLAKSSPLRV